ncbi:hypothetical protein Bca4012_026539 [Brassica carinata]
MVVEDVEKSNHFWGLFKLKHPRSTPSYEDVLALCQSPEVCKSWSREDQIRLCYLAILTGGFLGLDRREAIPPAKAKLLMDLEIFEQYPWGRVAFVELFNQIKTKTESGDIMQGYMSARRSCKLFRSGHTLIYLVLEKQLVVLSEHQDDDLEIDNLLEFLRQEKSLSTITWQALPEYPLTPIKCNKRRRVASQRKSKKSKKLASREQENVGDGGENSGDIAENKDQVESDDDEGKYFIQRRQSVRHLFQELTERVEAVEKLINSEPVSAIFQSPTGITMDNLASRVTQLEEIYQVKIPEHDQFSNTKLPAKPAIPEKLEGSIVETTAQGIGGPQVPEKEEEKKEDKPVGEVHPDDNAGAGIGEDLEDVGEGIDVEECSPQTVEDFLTDENAGADIDDQLTFEGEGIEVEECAPQTVKEVLTDENAEADIDDQLTFEGKGIEVEECAPQTVKEVLTGKKAGADIDHDLTFEGEGIDVEECAPQTARGHPDNPEAENAGEDIVDGLLQDINQSYLLEKAEPSKKQDRRLLTPKVEAASESNKEPDYERAVALSSESNDLTYPHPFTPKEKTDHFETTSSADVTIVLPSKDLELQVLERKMKKMLPQANNPPPRFQDSRIPMMWVHNYKEWQRSSILPGGTYSYYHEVFPRYARTYKWWKGDVDTIFSCLNVKNNTHWVAMVISIPDRTVKLYDSGRRTPGDIALKKQAEPFAFMVPYAIYMYTSEEEQPSVDLNPFKIECIRDGVPRARSPYGDCGVYALKFLECLMLGVDLKSIHLNDAKMAEVREKLAVEMYLATTKEGVNMWDPTLVTDIIDGKIK